MTRKKKKKIEYLVGDINAVKEAHTITLPACVPDVVKKIIGLKSLGMSNIGVAAQLGLSESGVRYHLKQYGLKDEMFTSAAETRRYYAKGMFERVGLELISKIKREDIDLLPLNARLQYATMCFRAASEIDAKPLAPPKRSDEELTKQLSEGVAHEQNDQSVEQVPGDGNGPDSDPAVDV